LFPDIPRWKKPANAMQNKSFDDLLDNGKSMASLHSTSYRVAILAALSVTVFDAASCQRKSDKLSKTFFHESFKEQLTTYNNYSFEDQYDIYIYGIRHIEPPAMYLSEYLTKEGKQIVSPLSAKLSTASEDSEIRAIIQMFYLMNQLRTLNVGHDRQLTMLLVKSAERMRDPFWRGFCGGQIREIEFGKLQGPESGEPPLVGLF
jgi:hypothetical protein